MKYSIVKCLLLYVIFCAEFGMILQSLGSRVGPLAADIEPYGLVAKAGVWYLVAFWVDHITVLRVEQILKVRLSERKFERPSDFDLISF